MIERIVENWLTNTNEIGYQIPFCQYLISNNFTILHISKHSQLEEGKDIISLDPKGKPCAFQLKAGDINGRVWREIKGEIDELVELPINYPALKKSIKHRAILVTNGIITEPVKRIIDDLNVSYKIRGFSELELITVSELLKRFLDVHGSFLPTELTDFKIFLELILSDGHELTNKGQLSVFLEKILFSKSKNKSEIKRKIASSVLLTQYVLQPYQSVDNHISLIEGWTMLSSYILALVEKEGLKEKYWRKTFDLILEKITSQLELLKDEFFLRTDFTEGFWDGGLIYKSRITIVLGWISVYELYRKQIDANYIIDKRVYDYIRENYEGLTWFWGESATPFFIMMSFLVNEFDDKLLSNRIIWRLIIDIIFDNEFKEGTGKPNPYFSAKDVLRDIYQTSKSKFDKSSFLGSSFHLASLVDVLVRKDKRKLLEFLWKRIFPIRMCEFNPNPSWKVFFWECKEGEQIENYFKTPQSWRELKEEENRRGNSGIPNILQDNPFMYFFLSTYPHRLTQNILKSIS